MSDRSLYALGDRRVTLEHLRAFVLLSRGNGFNEAGLQLHRTQSAVTQSLKKLEKILDCKLIERRQGHVSGLTAEGHRFLPAAYEILHRMNEAIVSMQRPEISGRIVIGVPDDFRLIELHGAISRCLGQNRNLRLEVVAALSSQLLDSLERNLLDVAIIKRVVGTEYDSFKDNVHLLRRESLRWVAAQSRTFDADVEIPLVIFPNGCCYRAAALAALNGASKRSYNAYTSASYENIKGAISAGLGIGILPQSAIASNHHILDVHDGFPPLPDIELVMIRACQKNSTKQLVHFLSLSAGGINDPAGNFDIVDDVGDPSRAVQ
ncbi:LysR family transcriptional regulator [Methylobacterium currus]|uniref:LysR family transcriptional regulator n=1 Tax=Methylobacterium currus TaxID=2051553 RepID=UPI001E4C35D2|nr:LysR family transcriptional regulator [Methylobacterium currus]UHC17883.1 LysR family transcriptional regulator [Methylobacterium currus]